MNPYKIKTSSLKESKVIEDKRELLKLELIASFLKIISKMSTDEVLKLTNLHKADLSRLRSLNTSRFSIDRIVSLLDALGYSMKFQVTPKRAS